MTKKLMDHLQQKIFCMVGYTIVRKEGKETVYWLRIIERTNKSVSDESNKLIIEGNKIVAVVSSIIKNTRDNPKNRK